MTVNILMDGAEEPTDATHLKMLDLLNKYASQSNSSEVLASKGRDYGQVIQRWALEDAAAFMLIAKEHGYAPENEDASKATLLALLHSVGATYAALAIVRGRIFFPDARIPKWGNALAEMVANMTVVVDLDLWSDSELCVKTVNEWVPA